MHELLTITNFLHLFLLLVSLGLCYFWGKLNGAVEVAVLLVENKLVTLEQLKKLEQKIDEE